MSYPASADNTGESTDEPPAFYLDRRQQAYDRAGCVWQSAFRSSAVNILYLAHRIPYPPDREDRLRSFREVEYLARRHKVWCACFVDTPSDARFIPPLRAYCYDVAAIRLNRPWALVRGLAGSVRGGTVTEWFYNHLAMWAAVREWYESVTFDVVVAFSSGMAPYALTVPAERRVLDLCDSESRKWFDYAAASYGPARWFYQTEGHRLALKERVWIDSFDATLLVTGAEALEGTVRSDKLHVVGNGTLLPDLSTLIPKEPLPPTVGFVGVMSYRPNVDAVCWFVSRCWDEIRAACPEAVFRIVGRSPARRVRRLARVPGVQVVGCVEDAAGEVRQFDVGVAPMRFAGGVQNKVLEAMAAGKPVVLTNKAALGLAGHHDREYLIADRPAEIVEDVVRLLRDPLERRRIGLAARRFVAVHHCWEEMVRRFELIVAGVVVRTARQSSLRPEAAPVQTEDLVAPAAV